MRTFGHWIQYLSLRLFLTIARLVPQRVLSFALQVVAAGLMRLDRKHTSVVIENLTIAFPQWTPERRQRVAYRAFANWGRIAAELAHVDAMLARSPTPDFLALDARVAELLRRGKGLLILSAHTANFELLARMAGDPKREIFLFHRSWSNQLADRYLIAERRRRNLGTLGRGPAVREALRVLARGGVIVVPLDQNQPRRKGVFVDMFGRPACTSPLLARLSLATDAPVLPVFAVWEGDALVASVGEAISPPASISDRKQAVLSLTERYTREIEGAVRAHPEQWNWAHRRWKTRPLVELGGTDNPYFT